MSDNHTYGIGHNKGPSLEPGAGWRRHCWKKARRALVGTVPLEIVRIRMRRAKELGLAYPQYASILTGAGRDVTAFLFTHEGLRLKLARRLEMPGEVRERLSGLIRCDRLALAPEGEVPAAFAAELQQVTGVEITGAGRMPGRAASWGRARREILDTLKPLGLPANGVILIGSHEDERGWSSAARLGGYLAQDAYFDNGVMAGN